MKLELKHLAPYLPYGLKAVKGITRIELTAVNLELPQIYHTSYLGSRLRVVSDINSIKPILRPLSDLTKEIKVNGEKFVPVEWFEIGDDWNPSIEYDNGNIKLIRYLESLSKNGVFGDIVYFQFGVIQKLVEWHFDIFGLIENELAIDINTLKE